MILAIAAGLDAPRVRAFSHFQGRYSDTTLTKIKAAATADTLAAINFVPSTPIPGGTTKILNQALYGKNYIITAGWPIKTFVIRNVSTVAAEVQIFGTMSVPTALATSWVADPDTAPTSVPASSSVVLESGTQWGAVQLHGRVVTAEAAAAQARLIVEYLAVTPSLR